MSKLSYGFIKYMKTTHKKTFNSSKAAFHMAIEIANELYEIADTLPAANAGSLAERSSGKAHGSPRPSMPTNNKFPKIA